MILSTSYDYPSIGKDVTRCLFANVESSLVKQRQKSVEIALMIYKPIFNLYCKNDLCSDDSIAAK